MSATPPPSGDDDTLAGTTSVPPRAAASAPRLERVGRFVLLRELGRGGMGVVWSAYDPDLDRKLAIKLIRGAEHGIGGLASARFVREARALARLNHPNVIQIHDVGSESGRLWLAMELVPGRSFAELMHAGAHGWAQWLEWSLAAGRGLAAAHAVGLVHRDFKPANVMVCEDGPGAGRVVVLDFGLARTAGEAELEAAAGSAAPSHSDEHEPLASLTRTADMIGTPAYMAPEQFAGTDIDARADQFAFAVTLFEALYGVPPFARESLAETVHAVTTALPRAAPSRTAVPRELERFLRRALQRDPSQRFASMDELLERLAAHGPGRRRRRVLASAVGLASMGAIAWGVTRPTPRDPCLEPAQVLARAWDDDARTRVGTALAEGGLAEHDAAGIVAALDSGVDEHRAAIAEGCTAAREHDGSKAVHAPGQRCLDRGALELGRTIELLAEPDPRVATEAVAAIRHLPQASACTREQPELFDDAALRATYDADRRLAAINTLLRFGRAAEARAQTEALAADIADAPASPLHAEVDAQLGDALDRDDEYERARVVSIRAALRAQEFGNDALFARVAADLAFIEADRLGHLEQGELWTQLGFAAVRRAGGVTTAELRLHAVLGLVRAAQGRHDEAIADYRAAIELGSRSWGADDESTLAPRLNLARALWQHGDWSEADAVYEQGIAQSLALHGPDHPFTLGARANRMGLAHEAGDRERVEAIAPLLLHELEAQLGADQSLLIGVRVSLSQLDDAAGRPAEGAAQLRRALVVMREAGEQGVRPTVIEAMLAALELRAGDREAALDHMAHARAQAPEGFAIELGRMDLALDWAAHGVVASTPSARALAELQQSTGDTSTGVTALLAEHALALGDRGAAEAALQSSIAGLGPLPDPQSCADVLALALLLRVPATACAERLLATADDPLHLRSGVRLARIERARAAHAQGRAAQAEQWLVAAIAAEPATYGDAVVQARAQLELAELLAPSPRAQGLAARAHARFAANGLRWPDELARADALRRK